MGAPDLGFEFGIDWLIEIYNGTSISINNLYKLINMNLFIFPVLLIYKEMKSRKFDKI